MAMSCHGGEPPVEEGQTPDADSIAPCLLREIPVPPPSLTRFNLFVRPCLVSKNFQDFFLLHRTFGHMHKALNVDEKN
jgi:hypothetical protein